MRGLSFKTSPFHSTWEFIKEIHNLESKGILVEECLSPTYWEFTVKDETKIPKWLRDEISKQNTIS
ncbi:hypothetical protein [Brevibacillus sp. BC25]|uniref:hypothetical protein n=1 Tax=Brevibacillus sp. BC25 TaxID=1144308 RepID=UPI00027137C3|nr:hypothetical protein [Brevibacillus sp. BC25]EJL30022.1 hypothetical protein PMI05_01638 [Brevibacillus sp. BC25]